MRNTIIAALLILISISGVDSAAKEGDKIEIEAEGSYLMETDSSVVLAREVALFTAKRNAVDLAARYLSQKSLIKTYELNRDEIYALVAREIQAEILREKSETARKNSTYRVQISAKIKPSDFVKAEIEDNKQKIKEAKESYQ